MKKIYWEIFTAVLSLLSSLVSLYFFVQAIRALERESYLESAAYSLLSLCSNPNRATK